MEFYEFFEEDRGGGMIFVKKTALFDFFASIPVVNGLKPKAPSEALLTYLHDHLFFPPFVQSVFFPPRRKRR